VLVEPGQGNVGMDPLGYAHTIDPTSRSCAFDRRHRQALPSGRDLVDVRNQARSTSSSST